MSDNTMRSMNDNPQLLLESGPMMLRDFNPKGLLRFAGRKCMTCKQEIMDHWLKPNGDGIYFCLKDGDMFSSGIIDCTVDIPEGFGKSVCEDTIVKSVCLHTNTSLTSMYCLDCGKSYQDIANNI